MSDIKIALPAVSSDRISMDLRDLTELIASRYPDLLASGILGGEFGYGCEYENGVFEMHPFWWGDCECGYEERERAWEDANPHEDDCYQSRIDWDAPREQVDKQVAYWCTQMGLDSVFGAWVHCTCEREGNRRAWLDANPHPETCPVVRPNFRHKLTGFKVSWYKYIGRSMEHDDISRAEWRRIFEDCEASLESGE